MPKPPIIASINCDLSCLTLLPQPVSWYIMGNEPDPLTSYRWLSNWLYTIILIYNFSVSPYLHILSLAGSVSLLLWVKILVPTPHEPAQSRNLIHPCAQFIDGAIHNIFHNGSLPPPNVVLHLPQPRRLQGLCHQWTLPSPLLNL